MKNRIYAKSMMALAAMVLCGQITRVLVAQNTPTAPATTSQTAQVQLSADVWEVLRLAHSNVGDGIITSYIRNSGKVYSLGASEILYLREQGLSDVVVTAMLEQRKNVAATTTQPAQASVWASNSSPQEVPATAQPAPDHVQPAPNYVQTAPVYSQPSPVYVYPPSYGYPAWPYYGGYWGYPALSFSFGYWGGHYGGYHGGGYHGGGYHGGGYHGGGYHGGGYHGGGGHH